MQAVIGAQDIDMRLVRKATEELIADLYKGARRELRNIAEGRNAETAEHTFHQLTVALENTAESAAAWGLHSLADRAWAKLHDLDEWFAEVV